MQLIKTIITLITGMILGMALLYFCSDELREEVQAAAPTPASPPMPAATICDCPAAEPPLAGRFVVASQLLTINGNGGANRFSVACPAGAQVISGSCVADYPTQIFNVSLRESGFYTSTPTDWNCSFRNNELMPLNFRASVLCLKPAP